MKPLRAHLAVHDRQMTLKTEVPDLLNCDAHDRTQPSRYRMNLGICHSIGGNYMHPIADVMVCRQIELAVLGVPHDAMAVEVETDSRLQVPEGSCAGRSFGCLQGIDDIEYIG